MKQIFKVSMVAILALFLFVGCRSAAVYNVDNSSIEAKTSSAKVYKLIQRAGYSLGWEVTKIDEGLAKATIHLREHVAVVEISYDSDSFSIKYKDSTNLNYNAQDGTIHKNYNGWIRNLEKQINLELSLLNN